MKYNHDTSDTTKFEVKSMIHIIVGDSAGGSLKYYLSSINEKQNHTVLVFRDDLSFGPLMKLDSKEGIERRCVWLEDMYKQVGIPLNKGILEEDYHDFHQSLMSIDRDQEITIWHGPNARDQVALRYILTLIQTDEIYNINIDGVDVSECAGSPQYAKAIAMCQPELFGRFINARRKIDPSTLCYMRNEWELLQKSESKLRILDHSGLQIVEEDYFDRCVISNCSYSYEKAARIVGRTLGMSSHLLNDAFIDYRLRNLVRNEKVCMSGKLEAMRDYCVKLNSNLADFINKYFEIEPIIDEDGFQHVLIEPCANQDRKDERESLDVEITPIQDWAEIDLSDKLIIDYNLDDELAITWNQGGRRRFGMCHTKISNAKKHSTTTILSSGKEATEESIHFRFNNDSGMILSLQLKPYLSIEMISAICL